MAEHGPPRIHTEPVVLELGAGVGALIVYTGPELVEREVEVEDSGTAKRTHTEIHERLVNGRTVYAGVFPELPAGSYRLLGFDRDVEITGGEVTEVTVRSA